MLRCYCDSDRRNRWCYCGWGGKRCAYYTPDWFACFCQRKGDWIVGDDNGVVFVPKEDAQEIANRAINVMERENRIREEIRRGSTLSKVLDLKKWK